MHWFTRFTKKCAGASRILLLAPPFLLSGWAAIYIAEVMQFLTAPGIPVNFEFDAPAGKMRVRAESYSLDFGLESQRLDARGVTLTDPKGFTAAKVDRLVAVRDEDGNMRIEARTVDLTAVRNAKGVVNFAEYLPQMKADPGAPETLTEFVAQRARIKFHDDSKLPRLTQEIDATKIRVAGAGPAWMVFADASFGAERAVPLELNIGDEGRVEAMLLLENQNLRSLWPVVRRFLPPGSVLPDADSVRVNGRIWTYADAKSFAVRGRGNASVLNLKFDGVSYSADLKKFDLADHRFTANGNVVAPGLNAQISGAVVDWKGPVRVLAKGRATVANSNQLPLAWTRALDGQISGVEWSGDAAWSEKAWRVSGPIKATSGRLNGQNVRDVRGRVVLGNSTTALQIDAVTALDRTWKGGVSLEQGQLNLYASSPSGNLAPLVKQFKLPLSGRGSVTVAVAGPVSKPKIEVVSEGNLAYRLESGKSYRGDYQASVAMLGDQVEIRRFVARGKSGTIVASGTVNARNQRMKLEVQGANLDASLAAEAEGRANIIGTVSGTARRPSIDVRGDLVGLKSGDLEVPLISAKLSGDGSKWVLPEIQAQYGFSRLEGSAEVDMKSGRLIGKVSAPSIQLAEFLKGEVAGIVQVKDANISGTLKAPKIVGKATGSGLLLAGATIQEFETQFAATNDFLDVLNLKAIVSESGLEGTAQGAGRYAFKTGDGNGDLSWAGVPLRPLTQFDDRLNVRGFTSGKGKVSIKNNAVADAKFDATFDNLTINDEAFVGGQAQLSAKNGLFGGVFQVGSLDRFMSIKLEKVDPSRKAGTGTIEAFNLGLPTVLRVAKPILKDVDADTQRVLRDLDGDIAGAVAFDFQDQKVAFRTVALFDPTQADPRIGLSNLKLSGRPAGNIEFQVQKTGTDWLIPNLLWSQNDQRLELKGGVYKESGEIGASISANRVDLDWVGRLTGTTPIQAQTDATIEVRGKVDDPDIVGALSLRANRKPDDDPNATPPSAEISQFRVKDRQIIGDGSFQASGFTGTIAMKGTLESIMPQSQKRTAQDRFELTADLSARPIQDFRELLGMIDLEQSAGILGGQLKVAGTVDDFSILGSAQFGTDQPGQNKLVFKGVKTQLVDPLLRLTSDGKTMKVDAFGRSSAGGTASISAESPLKIDDFQDIRSWLARTPISGSIKTDGFLVREGDAANRTLIQAAAGQNELAIAGTLKEPLIRGQVFVQDIDVDLPEFKSEGVAPEYPINPRFDLDLFATNPIQLRTGQANISANATGKITGTLLQPVVAGTLAIEKGLMKLPNARINLEQGGSIGLLFRTYPDGSSELSAPIQLEGRTSVSARRLGAGFQRYDIRLQFTGDLLRTGELQIRGESDPADLSQQQILAIVGQQELITALAAGASDLRSNEFQQAVIGFVLPTLTEGLTNEIAKSLNLDYLALEYNAFEGAVITGGFSFDRFLSLEGRRALQARELFGFPNASLRLIYRIPSRSSVLSRARFVLSTDNTRPWRLAIEYSIRL